VVEYQNRADEDPSSGGSLLSRLRAILHLLTPVALALSWTVAYFSHQIKNFDEIFDSDGLLVELLWVDIFQNGGKWSDWYLPHAPRFLPDMALYLGIRGLLPDEYWGFFVFGLGMLLLVYFPAVWLASVAGESASAVLLTQCTVLSTCCFLALEGLRPYSWTYAATFHTGVLIHGMLLIIFYTYLCHNPTKTWPWVAIASLATIGAASDLFFVLVFVGPFCLALCLEKLFGTGSKATRLIPLFVVGTVAGIMAKNSVTPDTIPSLFDFSKSLSRIWAVPGTFLGMFEQNPLVSSVQCLFYLLLLAQTVEWFGKRIRKGREGQAPFPIWQVTLLISVTTLVLSLAVRGLFDPEAVTNLKASRLLISVPWLAILMPWLPIKDKLKNSRMEAPLVLLLGVLVITVAIKFNPLSRQYYWNYQPPRIRELDRRLTEYEEETGRKIRLGVATYWPTKEALALSRHDLIIGQYTAGLDRYYCLSSSSSHWYSRHYDFALASFSEEDNTFLSNLLDATGPPERIYRCGDLRLVIFPPNSIKAMSSRLYGHTLFDIDDMQSEEGVERVEGRLYSPTDDRESDHIIIFGPHIPLEEGSYEVSLEFEVGDKVSTGSGSFRCEVHLSEADASLAEKRIEVPTTDRHVEVKIPFTISTEAADSSFEFRVWKEGAFDLTLQSIQLRVNDLDPSTPPSR
jgi:hypothetical protein